MDITAIRAELATAVATAATAELEGTWYSYDYPPGAASLPALIVGDPTEVHYHTSFASGQVRIPLFVCVPRVDDIAATRLLDDAMSSPGVPTELEHYTATHWSELTVERAGPVRADTLGTVPALVTTFDLLIIA